MYSTDPVDILLVVIYAQGVFHLNTWKMKTTIDASRRTRGAQGREGLRRRERTRTRGTAAVERRRGRGRRGGHVRHRRERSRGNAQRGAGIWGTGGACQTDGRG